MKHILIAVDDTPAGLAAAREGVELAVGLGGQVRALYVLVDGLLEAALERQAPAAEVRGRRQREARAALDYVADLAGRSGVPVEALVLEGEPARRILEQGDAWPADLIVMGGAGRGRVGEAAMGSAVRRVLEFADVPVLVVPAGLPRPAAGERRTPREEPRRGP